MKREQEVLLAFALPMEEVGDVKNLVAIKGQRGARLTAKPMVVVEDVSSWDAPRVLKGEPTIVLHMVEGEDAVTRIVLVQQGGSLGCVYVTVVVRDARWRIAPRVLKVYLVSASLMVVDAGVSFLVVPKALKEAPCSAKHMVVAKGAHSKAVPRVQKEVPLFARVMVVGNDVLLKVVEFVQRVSMVEPFSAWHMVVARDVRCLVAQEVLEGVPTVVFVMVVVRDANSKGVGKALRAAQTSVRPMVVGRDAHGDNLVQNLEMMVIFVIHSPGARLDYVLLMVLWFRINGFTVVPLWELWFMMLYPPNLQL